MKTAEVSVPARLRIGSEEAKPLKKAIARVVRLNDYDIENRNVAITAILGTGSTASHFVISVEGTPPRATVIVDAQFINNGEYGTVLAFFSFSRIRRVRGKIHKIVCDFLKSKKHLFEGVGQW